MISLCGFPASGATLLQSFDHLFIGDDASESFEFVLPYRRTPHTKVRLTGFVENLNVGVDGEVRFNLGWQSTNGGAIQSINFPEWPIYLDGVHLPPADATSGPVRVPIEFEAHIGFSPGWVKFSVEGLTGGDNFRLVGELTIRPGPRVRGAGLGG